MSRETKRRSGRGLGTGLGKGLGSLLGDPLEAQQSCSPELIEANPEQPRRRFDEAQLTELSVSIKRHGLLLPLLQSRN